MKYSLYLVSALVLISCVSAGRYYHHNQQPYNHGSNIAFNDLESDLVYFGIDFIFQKAADKFGVSDNNVQVTLINDFGVKWNGDWYHYWFNVDATNNDDASVEANFGVNYNRATGEKNMGRWNYQIHLFNNNNNNNNNVNVNVNPIANEENNIEGVLGLNEENAFTETELGFEQGQGGAGGEAGAGSESEAEFPVESEAEAGVSGEAESVLPVESEAEVEAGVSGEAESVLPVVTESVVESEAEAGVSGEAESVFPVESEAEAGVSGEAESVLPVVTESVVESEAEVGVIVVTESVLPVESESEAGVSGVSESAFPIESEAEVETGGESADFEDVPQDQQNNPVINRVLILGAQFIFNDAANNFGLSNNGIQITDIEDLQRRNAGNDHTQYRAHVQATNNEGGIVDAWFIVDVNNATQEMRVVGHWSYLILNEANGELVILEEESNFALSLL